MRRRDHRSQTSTLASCTKTRSLRASLSPASPVVPASAPTAAASVCHGRKSNSLRPCPRALRRGESFRALLRASIGVAIDPVNLPDPLIEAVAVTGDRSMDDEGRDLPFNGNLAERVGVQAAISPPIQRPDSVAVPHLGSDDPTRPARLAETHTGERRLLRDEGIVRTAQTGRLSWSHDERELPDPESVGAIARGHVEKRNLHPDVRRVGRVVCHQSELDPLPLLKQASLTVGCRFWVSPGRTARSYDQAQESDYTPRTCAGVHGSIQSGGQPPPAVWSPYTAQVVASGTPKNRSARVIPCMTVSTLKIGPSTGSDSHAARPRRIAAKGC